MGTPTAPLETVLLRHTRAEVPIICGAMYPCSNPELVAAVSEAGGIGIVQPISLTYVHGHEFRAGLQLIRGLTSKPVGMNVLIEASSKAYLEQMRRWLDVALEEGIRFFVTSLGNPKSKLRNWRGLPPPPPQLPRRVALPRSFQRYLQRRRRSATALSGGRGFSVERDPGARSRGRQRSEEAWWRRAERGSVSGTRSSRAKRYLPPSPPPPIGRRVVGQQTHRQRRVSARARQEGLGTCASAGRYALLPRRHPSGRTC